MYQSIDPERYTYQSSDPEGCTYQSSASEGCTYQSSAPEGCTYQSSALEGCTYQSSALERCTYQSSAPERYTYPSWLAARLDPQLGSTWRNSRLAAQHATRLGFDRRLESAWSRGSGTALRSTRQRPNEGRTTTKRNCSPRLFWAASSKRDEEKEAPEAAVGVRDRFGVERRGSKEVGCREGSTTTIDRRCRLQVKLRCETRLEGKKTRRRGRRRRRA
ncbi:NBS-LRR type resistance protein [Cucumis melo var. makuwa]|uniref:NBS-LRR type resistance protein n=1 Tax=Cucumis melo var. makuwa TaxID=1194695 RepID=A0A5D3C3P1_CUCMM|nr:NBS-LRR type resistance protein [Cucumis melo var. makuwa]